MKNTNKKGFTIVELVIVVAVIAILAAVLIPTFSGIIAKANLSADQKAVHDMNTALAIEMNPDNIDAAIDALVDNGFNSDHLIPVSAGYSFVWDASTKSIVLVPTNEVNGRDDLRDCLRYIDVVANTAADLQSALNTGNENIKLSGNIELTDEVTIPAGAEVTLDLGGKALTTVKSGPRSKYINVEGTLNIVNGTIESRGIKVKTGGHLVINDGVTVANVDNDGGSAIRVLGGTVEINGGLFTANNGEMIDGYDSKTFDYNAEPGVVYCEAGNVVISGGRFESTNSGQYVVYNVGGEVEINGGEFFGRRGCVSAAGGETIINGGKFENVGVAGHTVYVADGNVTINKGTFKTSSSSANYVFFVDEISDDGKTAYSGSLALKAEVVYNETTVSADATYKCVDGDTKLK